MKLLRRKFHALWRKPLLTILVSALSISLGAAAGSLTPGSSPAGTMHTLAELYNAIADTFDSSAITADQNGSLLQNLKYIDSQIVWASGSSNIWNLNSGNVGIGTTSPAYKLEIGTPGDINLASSGASIRIAGTIVLTTRGNSSLFVGAQAGQNNVTGYGNTAVGSMALSTNVDGVGNTALGASALRLNTASFLTAIGYVALTSNTTGIANTAVGNSALSANTIGSNNTAMGNLSLLGNTEGNRNSAFGHTSLFQNSLGQNNTALGAAALFNNTEGSSNTAVGDSALYLNVLGTANVAVGYQSLFFGTMGQENAALGAYAAHGASGSYDTYLGAYADASRPDLKHSIALGYRAIFSDSNQLVIGSDDPNSYISEGYFGSGVSASSPVTFRLHATGGRGTNVFGAALTLAGGISTGVASGGDIFFQTAPASDVSSEISNPLATRMIITVAGNVGIGTTVPRAALTVSVADENDPKTGLLLKNQAASVFDNRGSWFQPMDDGSLSIYVASAAYTYDPNGDFRVKNYETCPNCSIGGYVAPSSAGVVIWGDDTIGSVPVEVFGNNEGLEEVFDFQLRMFENNQGPYGFSIVASQGQTFGFHEDQRGYVSVGPYAPVAIFTVNNPDPVGSLASSGFSIFSWQGIGAVVSISAPTLTSGGSMIQMTVPASTAGPGKYLLVRDINGVTYASLGNGGRLTLRRNILTHGAVSNCTGSNAPTAGCIDYAETFPTADTTLQPGEVVAIDPTQSTSIIRASTSANVVGIISTNPASLIDGKALKTGADAGDHTANEVPIALAGRVPVNISEENGSIAPGDHLTVSATRPGFAMKQTSTGMSVGIALESSGNASQIMTFVNTGYWAPSVENALAGADTPDVSTSSSLLSAVTHAFQALLGIVFEHGRIQTEEVQANRICVGATCVTEEQFLRMVELSHQSPYTPAPLPTESPVSSETPAPVSGTPDVTPAPSDTVVPTDTPTIAPTPDAIP